MYQAAEALKELYRSDSTEKNFIAEFWKPGESLPFLTIFDGTRFRDMTLEESLSSDENLNFGSCEASQVKLAVTELDTEVKGCEMTLYQTLEGLYPAPDLYPGVDVFPSGYIMPLGKYVIQSADRQANQKYREIVALDFMCKFDVDVVDWYNALPFPLTLRDFRARLCRHVGVKEYVPGYLPNDGMLVKKTIEAAELIGRNVLIACEQANGAFGHFDRNGVLQHIILEPNCGLIPGADTIPGPDLLPMRSSDMNDHAYAEKFDPYLLISCEMDEYMVQSIEKVQIRQEEGDIGAIYGTGTNCLTVEGNFLLFGKSASELNSIAQGIYGMVSGRMYVPFHCDLKGLPYVEVGDSGSFEFGENRMVSYVLKRTLKGIYALKDTYEATGEEIRSVENNVNTEIIQLKGKAAILRRNVDEVSANLIDFEKQTEALFKITAEEILAEVKRAQDAEAALSVRADQITASVKSLKEETEAQFEITASQITSEVTRAKEAEQSIITQTAAEISLKVSKGDVSSQLSIEPEDITLKTNRLSWESTYSSMTKDGTLTCENIHATNGYFSGNLETDIFNATDAEVRIADYYISADGTNVLRSLDDSVILQTAIGGPLGSYTRLKLQSAAGITLLTDQGIETTNVIAARVRVDTTEWSGTGYKGDVGRILDYIWNDGSYGISHLGHEVRSLQSQVDELYDMINSL